MLLRSLSIVDLYGALSVDVPFNEEITLLVGINGSGKTSVLNVVDWLLKPDLPRLGLADYENLALHFREGEHDYVISAVKSEAKVVLSIVGGDASLEPITFDRSEEHTSELQSL